MADQDKASDLDEEAIYAEALVELKSGKTRPGLWAKAFAESEGDESKSQALYIKLRVQHERERRQQEQKAVDALAVESAQRRAEEFFAVIEQLRLKGYEAKRAGDGWTVWEPLGGHVRLGSDKSLLEYAEGRVPVMARVPGSSERHEGSSTKKERQGDQGLPKEQTGAHFSEPVAVSAEKTVTSIVSEERKRPLGVRGWLFLLVAGLLVLGPLLGAGRIGADVMTAEDQYPALKSLPQWANFKAVTWLTFFVIAALSVSGGLGLAVGKDWSVVKRAKIILWLVGPVGALVMGVIVPLATLGESNGGHAQFVGGLIASIVAAGIWTVYLSKSKRVRNTYGPPT